MASTQFKPASGLGGHAFPRHVGGRPAGIKISERSGLSICSVLARKGRYRDLLVRVRDAFGVEPPNGSRRVGAGPASFIGVGPGQWLALAEGPDAHEFERRLRTDLSGLASVANQSDARSVVRVEGPRARDALLKGMHVDLHPTVFGPGSAAVTAVAHIGVQLWQLDAQPTYELAMFRSFAISFWEWLIDAGAEYGIDIVRSN